MTASEDFRDFEHALRARTRATPRFDRSERAVYAYDASNYRQVPRAVLHPADLDDVRAAVAVAKEHKVPVVPRGAGTSIAGQAVSPGALVLDFRRHVNNLLHLDPEARTARVEPGLALDALRSAARPHGLTFGPDPSTHSRCTLGGMIGNDSCGSHSVAWGRTADNVLDLDLLLPDGTELTVTSTGAVRGEDRVTTALRALANENLATLRTAFPDIPRRVSGYALDALLPERGFNLARALTGTEGTCAIVLGATVRLPEAPAARALLVAGYADESSAADAVPQLLPHHPLTCEGMAHDLIEALLLTGRHPAALDRLPKGRGWLFLEVGGDSAAAAEANARALADVVHAQGGTTHLVTDPAEQRALWAVREAASGTATRLPDGSEAWPGWEDSAVPPARLGAYLRDLRALLRDHGMKGVPYGHFGEGCVHIRIDFPVTGGQNGRQSGHPDGRFRAFMENAADLVVAHGGSLSGEHGDGQARAELLPRMYAPEVIDLFSAFKQIWDPDNLLNPGNLIHPRKLDADLRFAGLERSLPLVFPLDADGGSLGKAARRCVGVGKCVNTAEAATGVMCPSYQATGEERHSTRGRARLLAEMVRGDLVPDGWRSTEVRDALDLCLSCKGCASDCPVHVDMATYKAEFLYHHYRGRVRPRSHYSLGSLPTWLRAVHAVPGAASLANRAAAVPSLAALAKQAAGITPERPIPPLASRSFTDWFRRRQGSASGPRPRVLLWPDTFSNHLQPEVGRAATEVLEYAGFEVVVPSKPVCCGLTYLSTGRLDAAKRTMRRTLRTLRPYLDEELPVVALEPSCATALRDELPALTGDRRLSAATRTLAGFLEEYAPDVEFPALPVTSAITQVHCHQHAALGTAAERRLAERIGLDNRELDSGCCGLAGNFGFERGHYEVSVAAAERTLLPTLRDTDPTTTAVLADGFSCRTQITQLAAGHRPLHLAELLQAALSAGAKRQS